MLIAVIALAGGGPASAIPTEGAQRLDVSDGIAAGAGGHGRAMVAVTIPKGTTLDWHYHPGTHVAWIMRRRLLYSVVKRTAYEAIPRRGMSPRRIPIRAGTRAVIEQGHGLLEPRGMQHDASTPYGQVITIVTVLKPPKMLGTINIGPAATSLFPPVTTPVTG